jgi:hypothetical protein
MSGTISNLSLTEKVMMDASILPCHVRGFVGCIKGVGDPIHPSGNGVIRRVDFWKK